MKKTLFTFLISYAFFSCTKHEIIPAPVKKVVLKASLKATIIKDNSQTDINWIQNLSECEFETSKAKYITQNEGEASRTTYFAEMNNISLNNSLRIALGNATWDANTAADPTLKIFNDFFKENALPQYSVTSNFGFEVKYKDKKGQVWMSDGLRNYSTSPRTVAFTNIVQESDIEFDYSKFTANFSCYLYKKYTENTVTTLDSIKIENAQFKAWFQR